MRKLKVLILLVMLFSSAILLGNDLKESVAIVRHDNVSVDSLYNQLGSVLQQNGFITAAKALRSYPKSFGSGFVYKAKSGKDYLVTNYHVLGNNTSASLQMYVHGKDTLMRDCPVLFSHRRA